MGKGRQFVEQPVLSQILRATTWVLRQAGGRTFHQLLVRCSSAVPGCKFFDELLHLFCTLVLSSADIRAEEYIFPRHRPERKVQFNIGTLLYLN